MNNYARQNSSISPTYWSGSLWCMFREFFPKIKESFHCTWFSNSPASIVVCRRLKKSYSFSEFRFYFPKKYMGEFCVVASPPLHRWWRSSAGSPEFLVRTGRCDGVFVVCGRYPSVKSDRMSASLRSTCHPELVSGYVEGTESKIKDSELNSEWHGKWKPEWHRR